MSQINPIQPNNYPPEQPKNPQQLAKHLSKAINAVLSQLQNPDDLEELSKHIITLDKLSKEAKNA